MVQLTYETEAEVAFPGLLADPPEWAYSISRANEETNPVLPGKPAVAGTDTERQFLLPSSGSDVFLGITRHTHRREDPDADGYVEGEGVSLLRRGRIWVTCTTGCAVGDPVYWRFATDPGSWHNTNTASECTQVPQAQWASVAGADELAVIDINLP